MIAADGNPEESSNVVEWWTVRWDNCMRLQREFFEANYSAISGEVVLILKWLDRFQITISFRARFFHVITA